CDVILIPEIPFDLDVVCSKVHERNTGGRGFSIIVVSEGAYAKGSDKTVVVSADESATGYERLGGVGERVARYLERGEKIECRTTVLGHVQRGGSPTSRDRVLGTRFGVAAVDLIERAVSGRMVALSAERIVDVALADVVGRNKRVDPDGDIVHAMESVGISFGR
ncbi:MAG: 6-phosphofructokinase, partial [Gemmatimonadetes bacterium]|nr:6-phosphofructokinase [Gemmatimonadota bacterium]